MIDKANLEKILKIQIDLGITETFGFKISEAIKFIPKKYQKPNDKLNIINHAQNISKPNSISLDHLTTIQDIKDFLNKNHICDLKRTANKTIVGDGIENAQILLIGEAPGDTEDIEGIPFCGRSGKLLENALETVGLFRNKNLYITNTVFWRPPNNRKPNKIEIETCMPILQKIINIVNPDIIITSGSVATETFLSNKISLNDTIGKMHKISINNIEKQIFPIYHPAYLLRNPIAKKILWFNLLKLKEALKS